MLSEIILKSALAVISALLGAFLIFFIQLNHKKLCALISFSAGALFSAAIFSLIPESLEVIDFFELILSLLSGYFLFYFISKYYSHICPACSASHFDEQTTKKFTEIVFTLLTALSLHSFLDGVAISSTQSSIHNHADSISAAITVHKFPEGLALAALMAGSGYSKLKIMLYVFLAEAVTIVGAIAGLYLFESGISFSLMGIIMAHIAGGFFFLAIHAVAGEMIRHHKKLVVFSFGFGVLLIFVFNYLI